jgi:hypothetical protein
MNRNSDLIWATLGEGGLIMAMAAIGWATGHPHLCQSRSDSLRNGRAASHEKCAGL